MPDNDDADDRVHVYLWRMSLCPVVIQSCDWNVGESRIWLLLFWESFKSILDKHSTNVPWKHLPTKVALDRQMSAGKMMSTSPVYRLPTVCWVNCKHVSLVRMMHLLLSLLLLLRPQFTAGSLSPNVALPMRSSMWVSIYVWLWIASQCPLGCPSHAGSPPSPLLHVPPSRVFAASAGNSYCCRWWSPSLLSSRSACCSCCSSMYFLLLLFSCLCLSCVLHAVPLSSDEIGNPSNKSPLSVMVFHSVLLSSCANKTY